MFRRLALFSVSLASQAARVAGASSSVTLARSKTSDAGDNSAFLARIPRAPPDAILGLSREFAMDTNPNKVNLGMGQYRDSEGKPYVLDCVKQASARLPMSNMDYAPIIGLPGYLESTQRICFGDELVAAAKDRVATVQTLSGTGALRVAAAFLKRFGMDVVHVPTPTYANHPGIFRDAGIAMESYPYYCDTKHELLLDQMLSELEKLPRNSLVLLHACAHNPTGFDPTPEQWQVIVDVMADRGHIPFVDMAYHGFATGDLEHDGCLPRMLMRRNFPVLFVAQSFAKNFGLYGQRTGALHVGCGSAAEKEVVISQLSAIARAMYSSPPIYGAQIVDTIVRDPELYALWQKELHTMATRMSTARQGLYDALISRGVTRPLKQIRDGVGMMAQSGLTKDEVLELKEKHHVYLINSGRIAFSGLTDVNLEYTANAIGSVMTKK
uniref:Aspartate transaminase n=1 Tax=Herpetomonas muscarum TaxID=5718 RepID=U5KMU4_HERMU|nr:aspartate transaminase [Herpetomonas muscarum]